MSRSAPHGDREVPAIVARACVFHEVFNFLRAESTRCLETERRDALGQWQVVVDGLRHMDDVDRLTDLARVIRHRHSAVRRVITTDRHDVRNAKFRQSIDNCAQVGFLLRRVIARHLQDAAACQMDAVHALHVEAHILLLAAREARKTIVDAEYVPAMAVSLDGHGGNDAVDAGRWPAATDNGNDILDSDHEKAPSSISRINFIASY